MSTREHFIFKSNDVEQLLVAARQAAQDRDFLRSIELLEAAAGRAPKNPNVFFSLGTMYGKRYDFVAAEKSFEQAVELSPEAGQALITAGLRSMTMKKEALAKKYFTRATAVPDPKALAFAGLAEAHWTLKEFPEAKDSVERALLLEPGCVPALLMHARLLRCAGELKAAELILTRLADDTERKLGMRIAAGCELARVLDLQKNYEAAMEAAVKAKSLANPPEHLSRSFARLCEYRRSMEEAVLANKLGKWFQVEEPPVPIVFVGGRAYGSEDVGIEQALAAHEDIFYLEDSRIFLDEVYFPVKKQFPPGTPFISIFDSLAPERLREMRGVFLRRNENFLQKPVGSRLIVEKNHVLNTLLLARIRVFPEARLMMTMRDPRDAVLESFMQNQPVNPCSCGFLSLAGSVKENVAAMKYWCNVLAVAGRPHLQIKLEEVTGKGDEVSNEVFSFLKVRPVSSSAGKPAGHAWPIGNWKNYQRYLQPYLDELNKLAEEFGY